MKIDNEFTVGAPVERAWAALTDLERLAPCLPGAQLTGVEPGPDGDVYNGKVKVKVGPVISQFAGTARFEERDEADRHAVVGAKGRDARGGGNASAVIDMRLRADGDERTAVSVHTDLSITGRLAQFGSGMIKEISEKLLQQFVRNLEEELHTRETPEPQQEQEPEPEPTAEQEPAAAGSEPGAAPGPEGEAAPKTPEPAAPESGPAPETAPAPDSARTAPTTLAAAREPEPAPASASATAPAPASASAPSAETPPTAASNGSRTGPRAAGSGDEREEAEALDLMGIAGASVYKRLIPVGVAVLLVVAVVVLIVVL